MTNIMADVVLIDAVRTAFGRAGEKGIFWNTRAEDLCIPLMHALVKRNAGFFPGMAEDSVWGVTNQIVGRCNCIRPSTGLIRPQACGLCKRPVYGKS